MLQLSTFCLSLNSQVNNQTDQHVLGHQHSLDKQYLRVEGDAHVENVFPGLKLSVEVFPRETQRLCHGGVDLGPRVLRRDELVSLVQQVLHGALLALPGKRNKVRGHRSKWWVEIVTLCKIRSTDNMIILGVCPLKMRTLILCSFGTTSIQS